MITAYAKGLAAGFLLGVSITVMAFSMLGILGWL
jgi:hypothetical protein